MSRSRVVERVQGAVAEVLRPGDWAVDATAGNGRDTCFLAERVGPGGRVLALDPQGAAVKASRQVLEERALAGRVMLRQQGHERLEEQLPREARGRVRAVVFNLGYRPGGDKGMVTRPATTQRALGAACRVLAPAGRIAVAAYTGHFGGAEEAGALDHWVQRMRGKELRLLERARAGRSRASPVLFLLERQGGAPDCRS